MFYQRIFHQILNGLVFTRLINWVHRDIHPSKIVIINPNQQQITDIHVKISDFGFARKIDLYIKTLFSGEVLPAVEDEKTTLFISSLTSAYAAPEIVRNKYDFRVDMYSAGVVLYFISCYPLKSNDSKLKAEIEELRRGQLNIKEYFPQARFRAHEAKNFMFSQGSNDSTDSNEAMVISTANNFDNSSQASKITFIAKKQKQEQVHLCFHVFSCYVNQSNTIKLGETRW